MGKYLARAAREARENAERRPYNIASAPPGQKGVDPSTVWRFEQLANPSGWPENPDHMIDLYAADLGIEPITLWKRALELWEEDQRAANGNQPAA